MDPSNTFAIDCVSHINESDVSSNTTRAVFINCCTGRKHRGFYNTFAIDRVSHMNDSDVASDTTRWSVH